MKEYNSLLPAEAATPVAQEFDKSMLDCQLDDNGNPWFKLADVAKALELSDSSVRVMKHEGWFDEDEIHTVRNPNGGANLTYVSESALYRILNKSKSPKARPFERWVTKEVLPDIRKHGMYATPATLDNILNNPEYFIGLLQQYKAEKEKSQQLEQRVALQQVKIAEMQPKANYFDTVMQCKDTVPISVIAKDYGLSPQQMNTLLQAKHIQYKQGKIWLPYQEHADKGYMATKEYLVKNKGQTSVHTATCWTPRGRLFIYEELKRSGILPLIERNN